MYIEDYFDLVLKDLFIVKLPPVKLAELPKLVFYIFYDFHIGVFVSLIS